jgi:hypothetical protein
MFWSTKYECPITQEDRVWVEEAMLMLADIFGGAYLQAKKTIVPTKDHFNYDFKGDDGDARFVLDRLYELMDIDGSDINLYVEHLPISSYELNGNASGGVSTSWRGASGTYQDNGSVKEIRIEPDVVKNTIKLISTLAHELAHYKLLGEERIAENDEYLTDLTVIAFGFGICMANSAFSFSQWTSGRLQGWNMSKQGYLPEPIIGYAMAWLAHYKGEDIGWKKHLNKTAKRYFTDSYYFIGNNWSDIRFEN